MKKEIIQEVVFRKTYSKPPRFKDINGTIQDEDFIICTYVEPYYSENNSNDGYFLVEITREREETDLEYADRKEQILKIAENSKKKRYEQYLKLKSEFENGSK